MPAGLHSAGLYSAGLHSAGESQTVESLRQVRQITRMVNLPRSLLEAHRCLLAALEMLVRFGELGRNQTRSPWHLPSWGCRRFWTHCL